MLRDLMDVIGTGAFASADDEDTCRFCEFAARVTPTPSRDGAQAGRPGERGARAVPEAAQP